MYLSKLEVVGFKSFAQKIRFKFTDGMSAIVGPNGCGKTNVVDAIRWVLGEQKSSVLRSDIMENVIFNGTKYRKPLSLAEVTLTIQNNRNILPTEYGEVTISRRLFRNGDSQYLLNKSKCRLRDITDLFMDTGMGSDTYSVIELKMVEAILSGKVEERRHLFEEAAGVNKYKARRKEALRKLDSVQTDLLRVEDIVQEVQKNVNSLYRQASKTRRYNKLLDELKGLETKLLMHEFLGINNELVRLDTNISVLKSNKEKVESDLKESEENLHKLNEQRSSLDEDYRSAREEEAELNRIISEMNQDMAVSGEKLSNMVGRQERLEGEKEQAETSLAESKEMLEKSIEKQKGFLTEKESIDKDLTEKRTKRDEALDRVSNLREIADESHEDILSLQGRQASINEILQRNTGRKTWLSEKCKETESQIAGVHEQQKLLENDLEGLTGLRNGLDEGVGEAESALLIARENKAALQSNLDNLHQAVLDKKGLLSQKQSTLDFLVNLSDSSESAAHLLKNKDWKPVSGKVLLAEAIGIDKKYRVAVDSALGETAKFFVVDTKNDAFEAIEILKKDNRGKAAFISRDSIPAADSPEKIKTDGKVFGWLSELARVDDKLRDGLRIILGRTLLVDSMETATTSIEKGIADCAVTLNGEMLNNNGLIRGGSGVKEEGATVGKLERIEDTRKEIEAIQQEVDKIEEEYSQCKIELESVDIRGFEEALKKAEYQKAENEQRISSLDGKKNLLEDSLAHHESNLNRYQTDISEINKEESGFSQELEKLKEKLDTTGEAYSAQTSELKSAEQELEELQEKARLAEMADVKMDSEIEALNSEMKRLEEQISTFAETSATRKNEIKLNREAMHQLQLKLETDRGEINKLNEEDQEAKNKCDYFTGQIKQIKEQIVQYGDEVAKLRKAFDRALESIHAEELKTGELKGQLNNVTIRAREEYKTELSQIDIIPDEDFDIDENRSHVRHLRDKLSALGNVNFMALEEFEKEKERLEFYNKQVKDLVDSEKTLQETISEINQTAEKKFLDTFESIQNNFTELFSTLFGEEGEAELKLGEGNPLESDIEIIAKPPGKRPHSIEMISSGEKTLTAIALLFAIYLVKPSPFCILDEVDAPLDDANIERFIGLIKRFSGDTQFLIVTHNKKTMEAADTLYGITMEEEGISKVVSVKLSPELV